MTKLSELEPKEKPRLMDLLNDVGVNTREWANSKRGKRYAALNPKFCYNWSFIEPGKVVVLNYWFDHIKRENDRLIVRENLKEQYEDRKSQDFCDAIRYAIEKELPIRLIILKGKSGHKYSSVGKRKLDPAEWNVSSFDEKTGKCVLMRGAPRFVDQFSIKQVAEKAPGKRKVHSTVFKRSATIRDRVLARADGRCEYCHKPGFRTTEGIYLETHHIIALYEGGGDTDRNVVALCPNHHREAHYGKNRGTIQKKLLRKFSPGNRFN